MIMPHMDERVLRVAVAHKESLFEKFRVGM